MNINDVSTQLLFTTLPIWIEYQNGQQGSGTGFIFMMPNEDTPDQSIPLLVTNYHLVQNSKRGIIELVEREGDAPKIGHKIKAEIPGTELVRHSDAEIDLVAIPIASLLYQLQSANKNVFFRSITKDLIPTQEVTNNLSAIEEITFIGYPSGLYDAQNALPIVRRGITATPPWNDFQGHPSFLIDAGVFPGSSGSPVFLFNQGGYGTQGGFVIGGRLLFLGVLSESIVRQQQGVPNIFLGIGKVLKSQRLLQFLQSIVDKFPR